MKFEYRCNETILGSSVKPFETYFVKIALYIIELLLLHSENGLVFRCVHL